MALHEPASTGYKEKEREDLRMGEQNLTVESSARGWPDNARFGLEQNRLPQGKFGKAWQSSSASD